MIMKIRDIDGDVTKDLSKKSLEKLKKEDVNKSLEKVFRVMEWNYMKKIKN